MTPKSGSRCRVWLLQMVWNALNKIAKIAEIIGKNKSILDLRCDAMSGAETAQRGANPKFGADICVKNDDGSLNISPFARALASIQVT